MTTVNIIAGLALATIVGLVYFINELLAEIAAFKIVLNGKTDMLNSAVLENESLKRKLEKINELTKPV